MIRRILNAHFALVVIYLHFSTSLVVSEATRPLSSSYAPNANWH